MRHLAPARGALPECRTARRMFLEQSPPRTADCIGERDAAPGEGPGQRPTSRRRGVASSLESAAGGGREEYRHPGSSGSRRE
eukprot:10603117-Alexandrium_andersonii.AAC.1